MKFKDVATIEGTAPAVWKYVGSPELWSSFHVKAGQCRHVGGQPDAIGAVYEIEFRLGSRLSTTRCEIVECRPGRSISLSSTLPSTDPKSGRRITACLTYVLEDLGPRTRVHEEVVFDSSFIPLIFRPLVWLLSRWGKPTAETTLMRLKRLVEEEN